MARGYSRLAARATGVSASATHGLKLLAISTTPPPPISSSRAPRCCRPNRPSRSYLRHRSGENTSHYDQASQGVATGERQRLSRLRAKVKPGGVPATTVPAASLATTAQNL